MRNNSIVRDEISQIENLLETVAALSTDLTRAGHDTAPYQEILESLQHRYHKLTGRNYHLIVEEEEK